MLNSRMKHKLGVHGLTQTTKRHQSNRLPKLPWNGRLLRKGGGFLNSRYQGMICANLSSVKTKQVV